MFLSQSRRWILKSLISTEERSDHPSNASLFQPFINNTFKVSAIQLVSCYRQSEWREPQVDKWQWIFFLKILNVQCVPVNDKWYDIPGTSDSQQRICILQRQIYFSHYVKSTFSGVVYKQIQKFFSSWKRHPEMKIPSSGSVITLGFLTFTRVLQF